MKNSPFLGNVVIITGAPTGLGRELAFQLADQGAWLALAARNTEKLEEVAAQCRQRGGQALVVPTDVSEQRHYAKLIEQTVATYGQIDTFIPCLTSRKPSVELLPSQARRANGDYRR